MRRVALATAVLADQPRELLYARVDLVRWENSWAVMELELVEPSLFLSYYPPPAFVLAHAIARRVARVANDLP